MFDNQRNRTLETEQNANLMQAAAQAMTQLGEEEIFSMKMEGVR